MTHTQHELPSMSDERNEIKYFGRMRSAQYYDSFEIANCDQYPNNLVYYNNRFYRNNWEYFKYLEYWGLWV